MNGIANVVAGAESLRIAYVVLGELAPDPTRSLLQYLQHDSLAFRLGGVPGNLYAISETLANGRVLAELVARLQLPNGTTHPVLLTAHPPDAGQARLTLDLGVLAGQFHNVESAFTSFAWLTDVLSAGARMLGAEYAVVITGEQWSMLRPGSYVRRRPAAESPLLLWASASFARSIGSRVPGMRQLLRQWDGALLFVSHRLAAAISDDGAILSHDGGDGAQAGAMRARARLFAAIQDIHERRQILRWLIHDYREPNEAVIEVLRLALEDPDWEVRVGAMLGAARLQATELGKAVRRASLPRTGREGLDKTDRRMLRAMQQAALALLSGRDIPPEPKTPPSTREEMQAHLMRCVAGQPVKWHDRVLLLACALTQPLPETESLQPVELPQGIVAADGAYRLAKTMIELVWVPPIPHWLGDELEHPTVPNPIRKVVPKAGFFITKRPITVLYPNMLNTLG